MTLILSLLFSCKKSDITIPPDSVSSSAFFKTDKALDPIVQKVYDEIRIRNEKTNFAAKFSKNNGYPKWNNALLLSVPTHRHNESFTASNNDTIVYLPLVLENGSNVNGFIKATINGNVGLSYSLANDFKNYPNTPASYCSTTKSEYATFLMYLDNRFFGHNGFTVTDSSLYPTTRPDPVKYLSFDFDSTQNGGGGLLAMTTICVTTTLTVEYEQLGCHPKPFDVITFVNCYDVIYDDGIEVGGGGSGSGGSGGGGEIPYIYPCIPGILVDPVLNGPPLPPCPIPVNGTGWNTNVVSHIDENDGDPPVDLQKMINCFSLIPDAGATYSVKLCTDIPVNYFPDFAFNTNFSPGHSFLTLTKTNGSQSISQSLGFYPSVQSLNPSPGEFHDNGILTRGHEYNASITLNNVGAGNFTTVISKLLSHVGNTYNLGTNNCTHVVVDAFNSIVSPPIVMPLFLVQIYFTMPPLYATMTESPQELFKYIHNFNAGGNISKEYRVNQKAPDGHGECN